MCAGLMVCNAASASSNAGFAASSFSSATALSSYWSKNSMFSVSHWFPPSTLSNCIYFFIYRKPSIKTPGGSLVSNRCKGRLIKTGGLIWDGGLFNLVKKMVSAFQNEQECKLEKRKDKTLEVMQLRIKNKSELQAGE